MTTLCQVRGLSKTYPSFKLSELSFDLKAGRVSGFVGRNGAGKTTTIKSILGLVRPDSGAITFFGAPLSGHERHVKERIGFSSGAVDYYPRKTLKTILNVTKRFYERWDDEATREYLELFALDVSKSPRELSAGMKVKFNLLLALSHRAELLILDEPTSGLDPFSRNELLEIFLELKARGIGILFSTHIVSDLEKCADDILCLRRGSLVVNGSKEAFCRDGRRAGETLEEGLLRVERSAAS